MSKPSPCYKCQERFTACHDHCPKDARGDYGHKAWKADMNAEKQALRQYQSASWTDAKRRAKWAYIKRDNSGAFKKFSS